MRAPTIEETTATRCGHPSAHLRNAQLPFPLPAPAPTVLEPTVHVCVDPLLGQDRAHCRPTAHLRRRPHALRARGTRHHLLRPRTATTSPRTNAQVDADQIEINAPSSGILAGWAANQGTTFQPGQILGRVTAVGGGPRGNRVNQGPPGPVSSASTPWRIAPTCEPVRPSPSGTTRNASTSRPVFRRPTIRASGSATRAEVTADAYPDRVIGGVVEQLQASASGNFTIYPSTDLDHHQHPEDRPVHRRAHPPGRPALHPRLPPGLTPRSPSA